MQHNSDFANSLNKIRSRFIKRLHRMMPELTAMRADLGAGAAMPVDLTDLRTEIHKIAGSARTFGFSQLSDLAADLEDQLDPKIFPDLTGSSAVALFCALDRFVQAIQHILDDTGVTAKSSVLLLSQEDAVTPRPHATPVTQPDQPPVHVMVVDDDEYVRDLLTTGFSAMGWRFTQAKSGTDALQKLLELSGAAPELRPDLILMDVNMPGPDGFSVLEVIKSSPLWRRTPVIMLTRRNEDINLVKGIHGGAQDYVTKPFDLTALSRRITDALASQKRPIMIASANAKLGDTLRQALADLGHRTVLATSESDATRRLMEEPPTLAILDSDMPMQSAATILRTAKENGETRSIPLIYIAPERGREDMLDSLRNGADDALRQPLDIDELLVRVQAILMRQNGRI